MKDGRGLAVAGLLAVVEPRGTRAPTIRAESQDRRAPVVVVGAFGVHR